MIYVHYYKWAMLHKDSLKLQINSLKMILKKKKQTISVLKKSN